MPVAIIATGRRYEPIHSAYDREVITKRFCSRANTWRLKNSNLLVAEILL